MSQATREVDVARPSMARVWWLAIRPNTLPAAIAPVLVGLGVALAGRTFAPGPAIACLAVALLLQVAANLANDLADFRSGADAADRVGPVRVAARGLATPRQLAIATGLVIAAAGAAGLYLVWVGGPVILVLGVLAVLAALAYTGGPWPYGYHGLGEVFVFVFFGLVAVIGTAYLQTGSVDALAVVAAVPMGGLATAILVVNNLRDVDGDRRAGKRTLAVTFGRGFARAEYAAMLAVSAAAIVAIPVAGLASPVVLLALVASPLAVPLLRAVRADGDPRRLNPVLKGTARLELAVAALLAFGLAVGGL
ncbi:MAG: 1,4-dihydroxy-2-naphthoate polyprenyltransferase [Chloroflexi bacterium]|jgi:1,4-dihydroxy-2-naphthoate octaprenyltransferase|nr:1,4-dihydroxy-2-naphthoate polyprenyltransferase [Chloroflexota bacterium]